MHLAAVSGAVDDEEAKMLGAIQIDSNSSTRTATCRLPSGQLLPLSPKHQGSAGQNYSILLDWNALIADQAALEAQQVEIETLLRLLVAADFLADEKGLSAVTQALVQRLSLHDGSPMHSSGRGVYRLQPIGSLSNRSRNSSFATLSGGVTSPDNEDRREHEASKVLELLPDSLLVSIIEAMLEVHGTWNVSMWLLDIPLQFHPAAFHVFIQSMTVHTSVRIPMRSVVVAGKQLRAGLVPPLSALFSAISTRTQLRMLTLAGSSSAREWPDDLMIAFEDSIKCLSELNTLSLQDGFLDRHTGPATARVLPHLLKLTSLMLEQPKSDEIASCKALLDTLSHARHVEHVSVTGLHKFHPADRQIVNKPLVGALVQLLQKYKGGNGPGQPVAEGETDLQLPLQLVSLNLTSSAITAADIAALQTPLALFGPFCKELIGLQELNLRANQLRDAGAKALAPLLKSLPHLKHIDVCDNKIESEGAKALAPAFSTLVNLTFIDLSSNWLTDSPASYVAFPDIDAHCITALAQSWKRLTNLQHLELGECCYDEGVAVKLAPVLSALSQLQHLGLRSWSIGGLDLDYDGSDSETAQQLSIALVQSSSLQHLDLHDSGLDGQDLYRFAPTLGVHLNLTCLDFQGNPTITSEGITAISHSLGRLQKLQKLRICCSSATTGASAALARSLRHLTNLNELSLSNFKSTEAGAIALMTALSELICMEELHLRAMRFGAQAAASLAESMPHMQSLKKLWLSSNPFGDSGAEALCAALKHATQLKLLDAGLTRMTWAGTKALITALERHEFMHACWITGNGFDTSAGLLFHPWVKW